MLNIMKKIFHSITDSINKNYNNLDILRWFSAIIISAIIFLITLIPSHDAFGVLYVIVIIILSHKFNIFTLRVIATLCIFLEFCGFFIVHNETLFNNNYSRLILGIISIITVTTITENNKKARESLDKQSRMLAHADRIKAIGQIGITIAHEVNQPLSAISTFAQSGISWINRPSPDIKELLYCLKKIDSNTQRAAKIIKNIRELTRENYILREEHINLKNIINDSIFIIEPYYSLSNIEIIKHYNSKNVFINGNKIEIQQLIINILLNSIESIKKSQDNSGLIHIILKNSPEKINNIEIKIQDNGNGFKNSDIQSCFEPFYTTKNTGMGIGLSICQTIAEAHNGTIKAENLSPSGAEITISFPAAQNISS